MKKTKWRAWAGVEPVQSLSYLILGHLVFTTERYESSGLGCWFLDSLIKMNKTMVHAPTHICPGAMFDVTNQT